MLLNEDSHVREKKKKKTGLVANVRWRAVPMSSVRSHGSFLPLPDGPTPEGGPRTLGRASLFRQDTAKWRLLRQGRVTGSSVAAALGLGAFEAEVGADDVVASLDDVYDLSDDEEPPLPSPGQRSAMAARLAWGKHQEAVGVLAAVRHFGGSKKKLVAEAGLCVAGAPSLRELAGAWATTATDDAIKDVCEGLGRRAEPSPEADVPVAASPDGFVFDANSCAVLEVKSVSPFVEKRRGHLAWKDRGPWTRLSPSVIPQVQLEIYCAGPAVTKAIVLSVSATKGATLFHVHRDDAYISDMLKKVSLRSTPRGSSKSSEEKREDNSFESFLDWTNRIAATATSTRLANVHRPHEPGAYFLDGDA
mmetsp:Transcript_5891/g.19152  ORF Transcript_5891/g.19152 Transcript_5891/m.19152 type:complete len:362 (+) Transcript_5891:79-1164(+)